jgi:hypothetical protein
MLCTITLKGMVSLFRVKDMQSLDSCVQTWTTSLVDVLKIRSSNLASQKKLMAQGDKAVSSATERVCK